MLKLLAWLVLLPVALLLWAPIIGVAVVLFSASPEPARDPRPTLSAHEHSFSAGAGGPAARRGEGRRP